MGRWFRPGQNRGLGHGTASPGEAVYSVRQNLQPLALDGKPTTAAYDWGLWGATLGGGAYVARSALGQDPADDLIYAASMSAVPADLAHVLARSGARIAMDLDINPPGSSSTPRPDPAADSAPRSTASTVQPIST